MTADQVNALRCAGEYLEISAPIHGFSLPDQYDGYTATSDLPMYLHDLANSDGSDSLSPGVTRIPTSLLEADHWYYFELQWEDDGQAGVTPTFGLLFDPSHWANTVDGSIATKIKEGGACAIGTTSGNDAWCIFESEFHDWSRDEIGREWMSIDRGSKFTLYF